MIVDNRELMGFFRDASSEVDEVMRADLALVENEMLGEVLNYGIFNGGEKDASATDIALLGSYR